MRKHGIAECLETPGRLALMPFVGSSRLTFKRARCETALPLSSHVIGFSGYLGRLNWLFGGR